MTQSRTLSVGLEVHTDSSAVASGAKEHHPAVIALGHRGTRQCDSDTRSRRRPSTSPHLVFVSEAGPCGSWLYRYLTQKGPVGGGVAPSLSPQKSGDRVQTNRRDALQLACLRRSGDLTPVYGPTMEDAVMRDLGRARAATLHERKAATLRLQALLLRHAIRSTGRAPWRPAHRRGLSEVGWPPPAPPIVFPADVRALTEHPERLQRLEQALHAPGHPWRLAPGGAALQALRGVQGTMAVTPGAALGALTRFEPPRPRLSDLGVTPSAYSTGARRRQGAMTKAGTSQARRALIKGAWASHSLAKGRRPLQRRLEQGPKPLQDRRWQAQVRLGKRYRPLSARGKNANQVVGAMARERRAFMGAIAQEVPLTPSIEPVKRPTSIAYRFARASAETRPRFCATLESVQRLQHALVPRVRQAPDGRKEGGSPPTDSRRSNRRLFLAPALPMDGVGRHQEDEDHGKASVAHS